MSVGASKAPWHTERAEILLVLLVRILRVLFIFFGIIRLYNLAKELCMRLVTEWLGSAKSYTATMYA